MFKPKKSKMSMKKSMFDDSDDDDLSVDGLFGPSPTKKKKPTKKVAPPKPKPKPKKVVKPKPAPKVESSASEEEPLYKPFEDIVQPKKVKKTVKNLLDRKSLAPPKTKTEEVVVKEKESLPAKKTKTKPLKSKKSSDKMAFFEKNLNLGFARDSLKAGTNPYLARKLAAKKKKEEERIRR